MNFFINQEITIHQLRITGLSNSSVLQVGSAGMIKPISNLYNTGGFTQAAPQIPAAGVPFVPLPAPS